MKKQKANKAYIIALEALVALALAFAIVFTVRVARAKDYNREDHWYVPIQQMEIERKQREIERRQREQQKRLDQLDYRRASRRMATGGQEIPRSVETLPRLMDLYQLSVETVDDIVEAANDHDDGEHETAR